MLNINLNIKTIDMEDYIPLIKKKGTYAGDLECSLISTF